MAPESGRSKPISALSSVLLPHPLVPIMAKMEPFSTSNDTSRCRGSAVYPKASPRTCSLQLGAGRVIGSNVQCVRAHVKDGIQSDRPYNAAHRCGGRCLSDVG